MVIGHCFQDIPLLLSEVKTEVSQPFPHIASFLFLFSPFQILGMLLLVVSAFVQSKAARLRAYADWWSSRHDFNKTADATWFSFIFLNWLYCH